MKDDKSPVVGNASVELLDDGVVARYCFSPRDSVVSVVNRRVFVDMSAAIKCILDDYFNVWWAVNSERWSREAINKGEILDYLQMNIEQYTGVVVSECKKRGYDVQSTGDVSKYFHCHYHPEVAATEAIKEGL